MADTCRNLEESQILQQPEIHLPTEIIIYIMEFLPLADRISASQVCHQWYEASREQKLHYNEVVILHDNISRPLQVFENSYGTFVNFVFKEVELGAKLSAFWDKFCPSMCSLGIYSCDVSERTFVEILARCVQLQSLRVNGCRELLMSGRVLEVESDVLQLLRKTLRKLKELSLSYNRYLSDALFNRFVAIAPNLEELSVTGCQISFHMGLYRLRFLDICGCNRITDVSLKYAFNFPSLQHLDISRCQQVTRVGLTYLAVRNPSIETLIMSHCYNVIDEGLLSIVKCLYRLKHLDIKGCTHLTDVSIEAIGKYCCNMKYLDVSNCPGMTAESVDKMEKQLPVVHTVHRHGLRPRIQSFLSDESIAEMKPIPPPPPRKKFSFLRC
ncbi:F-box/LRR-repeat protein 7 isoform X2 [Anabrus simplex]|uniref:F-box/LRR-repeat protein 7 isoform X2 n=1 Tax=Anabrus simplex TaxID=316456 RepID=UPI0035A31B97